MEERAALKTMWANPSIVVLKADKRNGTVLLGSTCYQNKMETILHDDVLKTLPKDPTGQIE